MPKIQEKNEFSYSVLGKVIHFSIRIFENDLRSYFPLLFEVVSLYRCARIKKRKVPTLIYYVSKHRKFTIQGAAKQTKQLQSITSRAVAGDQLHVDFLCSVLTPFVDNMVWTSVQRGFAVRAFYENNRSLHKTSFPTTFHTTIIF